MRQNNCLLTAISTANKIKVHAKIESQEIICVVENSKLVV